MSVGRTSQTISMHAGKLAIAAGTSAATVSKHVTTSMGAFLEKSSLHISAHVYKTNSEIEASVREISKKSTRAVATSVESVSTRVANVTERIATFKNATQNIISSAHFVKDFNQKCQVTTNAPASTVVRADFETAEVLRKAPTSVIKQWSTQTEKAAQTISSLPAKAFGIVQTAAKFVTSATARTFNETVDVLCKTTENAAKQMITLPGVALEKTTHTISSLADKGVGSINSVANTVSSTTGNAAKQLIMETDGIMTSAARNLSVHADNISSSYARISRESAEFVSLKL